MTGRHEGRRPLPPRRPELQLALYTKPGRYHWMLQYYMRDAGVALSWVGTGRLIFSLNYTDADFAEVADRFVAATEKMKRDGWWWHDAAMMMVVMVMMMCVLIGTR